MKEIKTVYFEKQLNEKSNPSETVYFEKVFKDTHGAFNPDTKNYTIVRSGTYQVTKHYNAGDVIEDPIMVRSV